MTQHYSGTDNWKSFQAVYRHDKKSRIRRWFYALILIMLLVLFLPWTQNIRSTGNITTLKQEQRPQQVNTIIPGKLVKWYVSEGDYVKAGDTILQLAEIKDEYLDPALIDRTREQLMAKRQSISLYQDKANASTEQIKAMSASVVLKMEQLKNKLQQLDLSSKTLENELAAAENDLQIASKQFRRQQVMYDSGFVSLTQLEQRNQQYQQAQAKQIAAQNKLSNTQQDISNTRIEIAAIQQEYNEKISKTRGEQYQSLSEITNGSGEVAKLENQVSNYSIRNGLYTITAPQSGQITMAKKAGLGEVVKEGEMVVQIVPDKVEYAVEIFVRPVDLPLIKKGQRVRFMFDGFPAIVFSGWPEGSFGTFGGIVTAVETAVSPNGKFRVLVSPDPREQPWPAQLSIGSGAVGMALLNDVPVWYELWRTINGFPPDFYSAEKDNQNKKR
ncbi:MAG: HlyD family efflux transporter periplasmic adaptor subunit [Chitinophagaceae bacterium]|nr:MAG: HlyD family efflux transporter periplasmic adaptor subunit [Chitinophagaceae bacterium]